MAEHRNVRMSVLGAACSIIFMASVVLSGIREGAGAAGRQPQLGEGILAAVAFGSLPGGIMFTIWAYLDGEPVWARVSALGVLLVALMLCVCISMSWT